MAAGWKFSANFRSTSKKSYVFFLQTTKLLSLFYKLIFKKNRLNIHFDSKIFKAAMKNFHATYPSLHTIEISVLVQSNL